MAFHNHPARVPSEDGANARFIVKQITRSDGENPPPGYTLAFRETLGVQNASEALILRLSIILEPGESLDALPSRCFGTWRVFDRELFETFDFEVYLGPPVNVPEVLRIDPVA